MLYLIGSFIIVVIGIFIARAIIKNKKPNKPEVKIDVKPNTSPRAPVKKALLVGINKYRPDLHADLRGCVNDVKDMRDILVNIYKFDPTNIRIVVDDRATKANIIERLRWLINDTKSGDELIFHYSGHGSQVVDRNGDEVNDHLDEIMCVSKDTLISTNIGIITAENLYKKLNNGDNIQAKIGNKYYPIISQYKTKKDKCIHIKTTSGLTYVFGKDHPLAVFNNGVIKYRKAEKLKKGDILLNAYNPNDIESIQSDDLWYMVGLFIGNGYFYSKDSVRFVYRRYKHRWQNILTNINIEDKEVRIKTNNRNDEIAIFKSKKFTSLLRELGFKPYTKKTGNMPFFDIPNNLPSIIGLLQGLFDSNGSSTYKMIIITMKDEYIIRVINLLLNELGIVSHVRKNKSYYTLTINNNYALKFKRIVGFRFEEKDKLFIGNVRSISDNRCYYKIPILNKLINKFKKSEIANFIGLHRDNISKGKLSYKQILKLLEFLKHKRYILSNLEYTNENRLAINASMGAESNYIDSNQWTILSRFKNDNFSDIQKFVDYQISCIDEFLSSDVRFLFNYKPDHVLEVSEHDYNDYMYDFTVKDAHKYNANGLLVHNCPHDLNWDDPLTDDILSAILSKLPKGVHLTVISDSCHSGSITRDLINPNSYNTARFIPPPFDIESRGLNRNLMVKKFARLINIGQQNHVLLSGCMDNQTSADAYINGKYNGALTWSLVNTIKENPNATYKEIHAAVVDKLIKHGYSQRPQLSGNNQLLNRPFLGGK